MKKFFVLGLVFGFLSLSAAAQSPDKQPAPIDVVNQLFTEMAAANPDGIVALQTADSQLFVIIKQNDGLIRTRTITAEAFSKNFTDKTRNLKEVMYDPNVETDGEWAMVWGRYVFFLGGKISHCGINQFNLIRTENGWKIANGASTIDPGGCTEKEKAMKP